MSDEPKKPDEDGKPPVEGDPPAEPPAEAPSTEGAEPTEKAGEAPTAEAKPEEAAAGGDEPAAEAEPSAEEEAAAKAKAEAAAKAKAEAAAKAKAAKEAAEAAKPPWEKLPVPPEDEDASDDPLVGSLKEKHGEAIESAFTCAGDLRVNVARAAIAEVCTTLKHELGYKMVEDLCGVHYPDREGAEFEVVYHLFNIPESRRVRLKVTAAEGESVPSVTPVYVGMNWLEREAYDMYGIRFEGHPDMTRILLWEGFNGYPLRKDFPVEGIDTGAAIYPEYYDESMGPVTGTGTGWRPLPPPEPEAEEPAAESEEEGEG